MTHTPCVLYETLPQLYAKKLKSSLSAILGRARSLSHTFQNSATRVEIQFPSRCSADPISRTVSRRLSPLASRDPIGARERDAWQRQRQPAPERSAPERAPSEGLACASAARGRAAPQAGAGLRLAAPGGKVGGGGRRPLLAACGALVSQWSWSVQPVKVCSRSRPAPASPTACLLRHCAALAARRKSATLSLFMRSLLCISVLSAPAGRPAGAAVRAGAFASL